MYFMVHVCPQGRKRSLQLPVHNYIQVKQCLGVMANILVLNGVIKGTCVWYKSKCLPFIVKQYDG